MPAAAPDTGSSQAILGVPEVARSLQRASVIGGLVTLGVGLVVLAGWVFDVAILRQVHPSLPAMKANAAIACILAGAALAVRHRSAAPLPCHVVGPEEASRPDVDVDAPARGSETVLLVEDDAQVRRLAHSVLRGHGYQVLEAAAAADAILLCERHVGPIHLLLTDVVMPRLSGRQLAERLIVLRPELRVLFMSGHTDDAVVRHGVELSTLALLQKPLTPDRLLARVREVLDGPGLRSGQP